MVKINDDSFLKRTTGDGDCLGPCEDSSDCVAHILQVARVNQRLIGRGHRPVLRQHNLVIFTQLVAKVVIIIVLILLR